MSADVHDHFVTKIAEEERQKKVWDSLNPTIFTIACADNLIFLRAMQQYSVVINTEAFMGQLYSWCNQTPPYNYVLLMPLSINVHHYHLVGLTSG